MKVRVGNVVRTDCIEGMSHLKEGSVDLVFADPPFNIGYEYDTYDDKKDHESYLDWSRRWIEAVYRVLKPDGTFWLAIGDEYAAQLKLISENAMPGFSIGKAGFHCRSWVIWYYTFGVHCTHKFTRSHAHLFHFVKNPKKFAFNLDSIRVPSARQLVYNDKRAHPKGRMPDDTWIFPLETAIPRGSLHTHRGFTLRPQDLHDGFRSEEDSWYFPRVCGTFKQRAGWHGCQMPEQLLARIIQLSSRPRDVVLDPFAGSGTTLAVAKKLHRKWLGFELSTNYAKQVKYRLGAISPGDALVGASNPLVGAPTTVSRRSLCNRSGSERPSKKPTATGTGSGIGPVAIRWPTTLGRVAALNGELVTATTEAYLTASEGYSIDRVLADPHINDKYQAVCRSLAMPGDAKDWNRLLLTLRKSGKLTVLPRPRRTSMRWEELYRFIFASEVAWRILSDRHQVSLDDILCDPILVEEFDRIARQCAPGWSKLQYRWGALTLRKKAAYKRKYGAMRLDDPQVDKLFRRRSVRPDRLSRVCESGGLYVIRISKQTLYLGESDNLRSTIEAHLDHMGELLEAMNMPSSEAAEVRLCPISLPNYDQNVRWGEQSRRLALLRPLGNVVDIQAVRA